MRWRPRLLVLGVPLLLACPMFGLPAGPLVASARAVEPPSAAEPSPGTRPVILAPIRQVTSGLLHHCLLTEDGAVWCGGGNTQGQLGQGTFDYISDPAVKVGGLPPRAVEIGALTSATCALLADGSVWCWGANDEGTLGDGTTADRAVPAVVGGLERGVSHLAVGGRAACAVMADATARCWGTNFMGALGDGTEAERLTPVSVAVVDEPIADLAPAFSHTCALTVAGAVRCWGYGLDGELGTGVAEHVVDHAVTPSGLGDGVAAISAGYDSVCALTRAGAVTCWGDSDAIQIGAGDAAPRPVPTVVRGLPGNMARVVLSQSSADPRGCAISGDGDAWCWGANTAGSLGDGTTQDRPAATAILVHGIRDLALGGGASVALLRDGSLRYWGDGDPTPRVPFLMEVRAAPAYREPGPLVPTITTTIPTPAQVSTDPPVVGANLLLAALAMVVFTIATELLGRLVADVEPLLRRRARGFDRLGRAGRRIDATIFGRVRDGRVADALRVLGIASFYGVTFALLDPTWVPASLTGIWLVLSFAVGAGLVGMSDDLGAWIAARRWGLARRVAVRPGGMAAALGSTAATRLLALVPGVMVGMPEAFEIDEARLDGARRGRLAAIAVGSVAGLGLSAWGLTLVTSAVRGVVPALDMLIGGLEGFLLLVFAVAIQNGFVALLPMRGSAGRTLLERHRVAWILALLGLTFLFFHTLLNPQGDLAAALQATNVRAFLVTIGVVLVLALGAWGVSTAARRRAAAHAPPATGGLADPRAVGPNGDGAGVGVGGVEGEAPELACPAPPSVRSLPPGASFGDDAFVLLASAPPPPESAASIDQVGVASLATAGVLATIVATGAASGSAPAPPAVVSPLGASQFAAPAAATPGLAGPPGFVAATASGLGGPPVPAPGRAARPVDAEFTFFVPGDRRLGGAVRVSLAGDRLGLDAGWIDRLANRLYLAAAIMTTVPLLVAILPVLVLVSAPDFRFYRAPWLLVLMVALPVAWALLLPALSRWRTRRRTLRHTECPVLAVEARTALDTSTAAFVGIYGGVIGLAAWFVAPEPLETVAAVVTGYLVAALGSLALTGRAMVQLRAPLDPEATRSVEVRLRARDRHAAATAVASIGAAQQAAGMLEGSPRSSGGAGGR